MAAGFTWTDFQPEPSILDPFRTIFDVFGLAWKSGLGQNMAWRAKTRPGPPSQACRFRNFFLGPIPELVSARFSSHFQEIPQIISTPLTQRNLLHFQETMQQISSGQWGRHYLRNFLAMPRKTCRKKFRNGAQKKFRNLQAWLGGPGLVLPLQAMFWPRPDFQAGPKTSKMIQNGSRIDGSG